MSPFNRLQKNGIQQTVIKRVTFTGAAGLGAIGTVALFTVTGDVEVEIVGICKTDLVGAATLEAGIAGNTAALLAQIADATTLDANEVYVDATPATIKAPPTPKVIGGGADIIATVGAANITAGVIDFYVRYRPLSTDGQVVAA